MNLNETQACQTDLRYFETMAWFESPGDAEEATAALAAAGYSFEITPYVFDDSDGILLTPTVYGVITGYVGAGVDEHALFHQLIELARPYGTCDSFGFLEAPTSQAERYHLWTGGTAPLPETAAATPSSAATSQLRRQMLHLLRPQLLQLLRPERE